MKNALLFMYTESSLHAGTGGGISVIDLPIQRERITQYPNIQGSGVKGALRSQCANPGSDAVKAIFGPDTRNAQDHAGALSVGEARVILFPVRSLMGIFAYTTCPHVLHRLARDAGEQLTLPDIADDECLVTQTTSSRIVAAGSVVLEEFSFTARQDPVVDELGTWLSGIALPQEGYDYWRRKFSNSLVILSDNAFRDFVMHSTEDSTHVRLDRDLKTAANSALWTQEALPSETLMASVVMARHLRLPDKEPAPSDMTGKEPVDVLEWMRDPANLPHRLQIGGDETKGQGCVAIRWYTPSDAIGGSDE